MSNIEQMTFATEAEWREFTDNNRETLAAMFPTTFAARAAARGGFLIGGGATPLVHVRYAGPRGYSNWRESFTDFDVDSMPDIPAGFEDTSWENDQCPSFTDYEHDLVLYVDYADTAKREFPETTERFSVHVLSDIGGMTEQPFVSDTWSAVVDYIVKQRQCVADRALYRLAVDTRNFSFEAYGISPEHCRNAMRETLWQHAETYDVQDKRAWVDEVIGDAGTPYKVSAYAGFRDGEAVLKGANP